MSFIVAIDGTAGTGKGTIAKLIAKELGFINVDTGITYRCVALKVLENKLELSEKEKIIEIAKNLNLETIQKQEEIKVYLEGKEVTSLIRSKEVNAIVSQVSSIPEVRKYMVDLQRKLAEGKEVIVEGRDITTVVFPNADIKIYMDAQIEERARRRKKENEEKGIRMSYEQTLENLKQRDYNDKHKPVGALKMVEDAVFIDTTNLSIEEVKTKVIDLIQKIKADQKNEF